MNFDAIDNDKNGKIIVIYVVGGVHPYETLSYLYSYNIRIIF